LQYKERRGIPSDRGITSASTDPTAYTMSRHSNKKEVLMINKHVDVEQTADSGMVEDKDIGAWMDEYDREAEIIALQKLREVYGPREVAQ
jgi:hypothetical protein